jgi:hypothetical protein
VGLDFAFVVVIMIYCSYKHTPQNVLTPITFELGGVNALKALICLVCSIWVGWICFQSHDMESVVNKLWLSLGGLISSDSSCVEAFGGTFIPLG